jgi:HEAT repeat protein
MDEWELGDLVPTDDPTETERRATLWRGLESEGTLPDRSLVPLLSGLLGDDLARIRTLWPQLSEAVRRGLTALLRELAEADFAMDFSAIFRIALSDSDAEVRTSALQGLREIEDVRLVPEYAHILRSDPSPLARQAAAEGLGQYVILGELQKIRRDPFRRAVLALQAAYTDPQEDPTVRQRAVEAMAFTGEFGVPAMIKRAYTDGEASMRRSAVVAMGRSADDVWGRLVLRELVDTDPRMRLAAVQAAGELQLREAMQEVVGLTDDVDAEIRAMSVWALGQIGGTLAQRTLQRLATGDDQDLVAVADEALQEFEFLHGDASSFFGAPDAFNGETDGAWQFPQLGDLSDDEDEATDDSGEEGEDIDDDALEDADYLVGYLSAKDHTLEDGSDDDDWDDYDALDDDDDDEDWD